MRWVLALVAVSGCDKFWGIKPNPLTDGGPGDTVFMDAMLNCERDPFDTSLFRWSVYNDDVTKMPHISNQQLEIPLSANTPGATYAGVIWPRGDLTNAIIDVTLVQPAAQSAPSGVGFDLNGIGNNYYSFGVYWDASLGRYQLLARVVVSGGALQEKEFGYDPTEHRHLRIRHFTEGGVNQIRFYTRREGTEEWKLFHSIDVLLSLNLAVELDAGTDDMNPNPGAPRFDDFVLCKP